MQLQKFIELIKHSRHSVFELPDNNVLTDGVLFEEDLLQMNYDQFSNDFGDNLFFKSISKEHLLDEFQSDVVFYGGIDLWSSVKDNKYKIFINKEQILIGIQFLIAILI